jgi:hypothetical protein
MTLLAELKPYRLRLHNRIEHSLDANPMSCTAMP